MHCVEQFSLYSLQYVPLGSATATRFMLLLFWQLLRYIVLRSWRDGETFSLLLPTATRFMLLLFWQLLRYIVLWSWRDREAFSLLLPRFSGLQFPYVLNETYNGFPIFHISLFIPCLYKSALLRCVCCITPMFPQEESRGEGVGGD